MMNLRFVTIAALALAAAPTLAQETNVESSVLKTDKEKFSYALGMNYGKFFRQRELELDLDTFLQGIKAVVSSNQTLLTDAQMNQVLSDEDRKLNERRIAKLKAQAEENKKKAETFLAENKTKPGVVTTEDGLQYRIIREGTGPVPGSNDMVTLNYRGSLVDGTEFGNSYTNSKPWTTSMNAGPKGWREGLQKMKVGSKFELFIPPALAYGDAAAGPVPPGSLLIFDVDLLSNAPAPPPPQPMPLTSDVIKVPSLEEIKRGSNVETLTPQQVQQEIQRQKAQQDKKP